MKSLVVVLSAAALAVGCTTSTSEDSSTSLSSTALPAAAPANPRAIDCEQASTSSEKTVCSDPDLIALDARLADRYQQAISESGSEETTLEAEQRGWLAGRDDCWKDADPHQCVLESYQTRLVELQINDDNTAAPTAVDYRCGDGSTAVSAVFYNDIDPAAMVLTVAEDQAILIQQPSGSGIRYTRSGASYSEHQGDVDIDFYGTTLACSAAK